MSQLDVKVPSAEPLESDLPPWVASAKYMNPLLVAYEREIRDLKQALQPFASLELPPDTVVAV